MKKLIITMGALAMFSLVAQAAELKGGMDFEKYTIDVEHPSGVDVGATDPEDENGFFYWAGVNGESVIAEDENGNKYLKVDTTEGLQRQTADVDAETLAPVKMPGDGGNITVSSKVQFTAAEDDPVPVEGLDKIIVWAKVAAEEGGDPKLMVTAFDQPNNKITHFDTGRTVKADTWYDLSIVAMETVGDAYAPIEFKVVIDGDEYGPYMSLLSADAGASRTIASIGFKGTGAVDDIKFAKEKGIVAEKFSFTATVNDRTDVPGLSSMTYSVDDGTETALQSGDVVEILCTAQAVTVTAIVYDDSEVTTEGFVKGEEAIALEDGTGYKWTKTISVAGTEADAKVAIDITIRAISGGDEPTPVEPSTSGSVTVTATSEADAISKVALTAPAGVANAGAYKAMFAMSATDNGDGTWTVTATLTADGETTLQASVDEAVKVAEILDAKVGTVTIKAVDGFYYYIVGGTEVKSITVNGEAKQAVGATSVELKKPELGETDKAFYRVKVSVMNPAAE